MTQYGLQSPSQVSAPALGQTSAAPVSSASATQAPSMIQAPRPANVGGVLNMASAHQVLKERMAQVQAQTVEENSEPVVQNLSAYIDKFWTQARTAKMDPESQMLSAVRARRGEYDPDVLADLRAQGSSEIFMMLTSMKCRQAASLLRDTIIGAGSEKPWTVRPNPVPELPMNYVNDIMVGVSQEVEQSIQAGVTPGMEDIKQRLRDVREQVENSIMEEARARCTRMEHKMETQLNEGGFLEAIDQFIDDLTTFKTAFLKGPVIRKKPKLKWGPQNDMIVTTDLVLEWERVDPFMMYPAPWAKDVNSAPLIERHRLSRKDLEELIGVEGYSEAGIRQVLDEYGNGGLHNWLAVDAAKAEAEGRNQLASNTNTGLIDALQFWGSVSGKLLLEWGLDAESVPDPAKEYEVEAWKIGRTVIKAALNADPLARRPYYGDSYERVPGTMWGNSLYDLMRDCQDMCNATARAIVNNMGISSGPQVAVNTQRMPTGVDLTQMYPWKIWQFESDAMGSTAAPIQFFQPDANAPSLMQVFEHFSDLADEYTGVPKYMSGQEGTPGAGRTASGLSMMIGNASKIIKQVIGSIDTYILHPMIDRLYYYNMRYGDDPDLKGDISIVARGAMSIATKEAAQVRRNEFLQIALSSPAVQQIIGFDGIAALLREAVKSLDMDSDKVVPTQSVVKQRAAAAQQMAAQQNQQAQGQANANMGIPPSPQQPPVLGGGQRLMNGAAQTDHFQPAQG